MPEKKEEDVSFAGPYVLTKVLGQGSYGKVRLGVHGKTGAEVAVKIMHKTDLTKSTKLLRRVEREVTILRLMNHPCVTQMIDVIQTATHLFIILEYMQGGDLYQYLRKNGIGGLPKDIAFRFFYQILSGLEYCHSCGVCHRDIKPENILLDAGQQNIKITDFGMANLMKVDQLLETSCGSPHYASPEVIQGVKYDGTRSDVWSMGVLLFGLCAGRLPFDDANIPRLLEKVCRGLYTMPNHFDGQLRDLIDRCLQVSADNRIRLKDIKQHPWWIEKCRQGNLPVGGLHSATLPRIAGAPRPSISNTSMNAPPPASTPKANATPKASVVVSENNEDGSNVVANSETLGLNHPLLAINVSKIPPGDLPNVFQKLQDFAKALVEENSLLRECFSAMHNESMPQLMEPPMSPEEMSRPVEEPFDETVVEFITVYQGWTDMTTLVSSLADERPNIEKAFYKLLLQQKTIYGGLNHLKEQGKGVAAHVSPINPIKKLEEIQGILNAQYAAPLRSQRVKSDSALVVPSDLTNLDAPKRKGIKGVFSKVFGKEKDKRTDVSPSETPPATPGSSSSNAGIAAPPINPINKAPTNVQFLSPRDRQRSAPALVSKKIHVG